MNYRKSSMEKAGFKEFPKDLPGLPRTVQGAQEEQHAGRLRARSRLGRRQRLAALGAVGARRATRSTRTTRSSSTRRKPSRRWNTPRRFPKPSSPAPRHGTTAPTTRRSCRASFTAPPTASRSTSPRKDDATKKELAEDTYHALYAGRSDRQADRTATRVPDPGVQLHQVSAGAAKAFIAFMLEKENYDKWLSRRAGLSDAYAQRLRQQRRSGPRIRRTQVFSQASKRALPASGIGKLGEKAAAAIADFLVVDMFANYCTGREDAKGAIADCRTAVEAHLSLTRTGCGRRAIAARSAGCYRHRYDVGNAPMTLRDFANG